MSTARQRQLVIHIGQHKTGSKALQSTCWAARRELLRHGVAYPVAGHAAARWSAEQGSHHGLFRALRTAVDRPGRLTLRAQSVLDGLLEQGFAAADRVLLSSEDLFDMHTAHELGFSLTRVRQASALLAGWLQRHAVEPTLVCCLRRQDELLVARYGQWIKGSDRHALGFEAFRRCAMERLDADALLDCWEAAFGRAAIRVFPYEPRAWPGGIVPWFFSVVLGLTGTVVAGGAAADPEASNRTPDRDQIEFMRAMNQAAARGWWILPRAAVLAAAAAERRDGADPTAAWLSPGARRALLMAHAPGNARIAVRYNLPPGLHARAVPDPDAQAGRWQPPGLDHWLRLDRQARARAVAARGSLPQAAVALLGRLRSRLIVWVVPELPDPQADRRAGRYARAVIGRLERPHRVVNHLHEVWPWMLSARVAAVIVVGGECGHAGGRGWLRWLRLSGVRVRALRQGRMADA
jgi:hypothetical protein